MQTFVDAEDAYLAWVGRHTDGYVLNAGRTEAPSTSVVLHSATCWSISGAYSNYTTRDYIKVCSLDRASWNAGPADARRASSASAPSASIDAPMTNLPRLLIATGNPGKAAEFALLLEGSGWAPVTPADLGLAPVDIVETGRSYLENAVTKAVRHAEASGLPALGDDSGWRSTRSRGGRACSRSLRRIARARGRRAQRAAAGRAARRAAGPARRALPRGRRARAAGWPHVGARGRRRGPHRRGAARRRRLRLRPAVRAARRPHDGRAGRGEARLQPSRPRRARPLPAVAAPERRARRGPSPSRGFCVRYHIA